MLRNEADLDQTFPLELLVSRELANPHSRMKKALRYRAAKVHERALLHECIRAELADLRGRTRREARAEATFRWRARIRDDRKAELKKRHVQRGLAARLERKRERQTKKVEMEARRLRNLVLKEGPNQVVPRAQL